MAGHTLNLSRHVNELSRFIIAVIKSFEFNRAFERSVDCYIKFVWHLLCDVINNGIRHSHRSANVTDSSFCSKSTKGYNLRNVVRTVFADNVINRFPSPFKAEINVKVGHADSFGVEESFKKQAVFHRVNACDSDAVSADARRTRASARTDGNALVFSRFDKIMNNQIIINVAHSVDNVKLIIKSVNIFFWRIFAVSSD